MKVAQPSIRRSAIAGHGRTLNVHRESKGENIGQNYAWMRGQPMQRPATAPPQKPPAVQPPQRKKPQPQSQPQSQTNHKIVHGKDITGTFKFDDNSTDYSIEQVIKAQGFDGKPQLISDSAAFSAACKASNFIAKRGIGASDAATLKAYDDDMKNGQFYVKCSGGNVHGYGMYAASLPANGKNAQAALQSAQATANSYAGSGHKKIYTFTMDPSAKMGNEDALRKQMKNDKAFQKICSDSSMRSWYTNDVGVYAAMKGYDGYYAGSGQTNGYSSDYTVILNRSKVILYDS